MLRPEPTETADVDAEDSQAYSTSEIRKNRRNILLGTIGVIVFLWLSINRDAAIVLTIMTIIVSLILLKLFASRSASKLGDDFAGSGKRVHPRTMGTILGFLYRGFRND